MRAFFEKRDHSFGNCCSSEFQRNFNDEPRGLTAINPLQVGPPTSHELAPRHAPAMFDLEALMRQVPAVRACEQLEAAWDREVGVPPGVRTDSKTECSSHTGLATQKQRVGAHARAPLRSAI